MKKIYTYLLAIILIVCLTGCNSGMQGKPAGGAGGSDDVLISKELSITPEVVRLFNNPEELIVVCGREEGQIVNKYLHQYGGGESYVLRANKQAKLAKSPIFIAYVPGKGRLGKGEKQLRYNLLEIEQGVSDNGYFIRQYESNDSVTFVFSAKDLKTFGQILNDFTAKLTSGPVTEETPSKESLPNPHQSTSVNPPITGNTTSEDTRQEIAFTPKNIEGIGSVSTYSLAENVTVETNFNLELMFTMAAVGADLKHPGYLGSSKELNLIIKEHFKKFTSNQAAKDLYQLEASETMSGSTQKFNNPHVLVALNFLEFLQNETHSSAEPRLKGSVFRTKNLSPAQINSILQGFASQTGAQDFYKNYSPLYSQMLETFVKNILNFNHVQRVQDFYGIDLLSTNKFRVIISSSMNGGQAADLQNDDGSRTYYIIINPYGNKDALIGNLLYHETAHNYYSVVQKKHDDLINNYSAYGDVLGGYFKDQPFEGKLDETLARVVTGILLEQYHGKNSAYKNLQNELNHGWKNIDKIYFLVKNKYLSNREQYKTFGDFLPVILEYIEALANNQPFDIGPTEKI